MWGGFLPSVYMASIIGIGKHTFYNLIRSIALYFKFRYLFVWIDLKWLIKGQTWKILSGANQR